MVSGESDELNNAREEYEQYKRDLGENHPKTRRLHNIIVELKQHIKERAAERAASRQMYPPAAGGGGGTKKKETI